MDNSIEQKLKQFQVPLVQKAVNTLEELRDTHMPAVKNDVVIIPKHKWEEVQEEQEPNGQLARLIKTARTMEGDTKYCNPELVFSSEGVIAKDKYVSHVAFTFVNPITALTALLQNYRDERVEEPSENSKYSYYWPEGKARNDRLKANRKD